MLAVALASAWACSDRSLYGQAGQVPKEPNKVSLQGQLCTDNPAKRRFPVKILFLVDGSGDMQEAAPNGEHVYAIQEVINRNLAMKNVEFGVIRYGTQARSLVLESDGKKKRGFTRDGAKLDTAMAALRNAAGTRDLLSAMSLARSIVSGDVLQSDLGPLSRTKYLLVNITSGSPAPAVSSVRCEGLFTEAPDNCELALMEKMVRDLRDQVLETGAAEFSFHTVLVEPSLAPGKACDPSQASTCAAGETCVQTGLRETTGRCGKTCTTNTDCTGTGERCNTLTLPNKASVQICAAAERACFDGVDNDGDGQAQDCADASYPYGCSGGGCELDCRSLCRAERLGVAMSLAAGGSYKRFAAADALTLGGINFLSTQRLFVLKELLVYNRNAIATADGFVPDSDADGLSDAEELRLGLDPRKADTDEDGYNDKLEHLFRTLGLDPKTPTTLPDCVDPTVDTDQDGLRDCEEKLLSTDRTLFDSDADGYPDLVEFNTGANPIANDALEDIDLDGVPNGKEILAHTDLMSNDALHRAEMAVRYRISPTAVTEQQRSCYAVRVMNVTLMDTLDRGFGPGQNDLDVYFGQVPDGSMNGYGVFHVAQKRMQYLPPAGRVPDTYVLELREEDFVLFEQ